jgi:hypothetical protein
MARINVDEKWRFDERRFYLINEIKSITIPDKVLFESIVDGIMLKVWRLSQDFEKYGKHVPEKFFRDEIPFTDLLVEANLIEIKPNGVYVRGSREYHKFLKKVIEGARKGGKSKGKTSKPSASPKEAFAKPSASQTEVYSSSSLSSSSSCSSSPSSSRSRSTIKEEYGDTDGVNPSGTLEKMTLWDVYSEEMKLRYSIQPVRNASVNSMLKKLNERLGASSEHVIRWYVQSQNTFYKSTGHSLNILLKDAEKLYIEWKTGQELSTTRKTNAELVQDSNFRLYEKILQQEKSGG